MNLLNVRRGQFVYYANKLHKVYSVKPFFKQSVHLVRLEDFEQELTTAKDIDLYRPKHLDSFVSNHQRYTLDKDEKAEVGDYILVINPRPDSLDHYHLHAIEMVTSIEDNGVISNKSNGIKHTEYWVMVPGLKEGAEIIDLQQPDPEYEAEEQAKKHLEKEAVYEEIYTPRLGDVFQKNNSEPPIESMVVAIEGNTIFMGGNIKATPEELKDASKWSFVRNILDLLGD